MSDTGSLKLRAVKGTLWFIVGFAAVVAVIRFLAGLGAVTNLTDRTPWGLWVGFDVLGGVALAAGGFVIAAVVYVLRREQFRPLLRPAVLTAFLGYVAVAVGLLFDLGRPWNIWRPMFFWQHHSALFEVAWCVMLYLTVLALEFAPVPLEGSRFEKLAKLLKAAALPLVILGIMLSTLHQSSLGTLFVLAPGRVHPLWYSPMLPLMFFVSAVALGMGMVIVESKITSWLYDRKPEDGILKDLRVPLAVVLMVYVGIRLVDIVARGHGGHLFSGSWESALFYFEIIISAILPAVLVFTGLAGRSGKALLATGLLVVFGFVLHRIDVGGVSGVGLTSTGYFPSWQEIATSAGVVSAAALVFFFFVERYRVYEESEPVVEAARPAWMRYTPPLAKVRTFSLLFVIGAGLSFSLMPEGAVFGAKPNETKVEESRRALGVLGPVPHLDIENWRLVEQDQEDAKEILVIDGNREDLWALFDHDGHTERLGDKDACATCHHLNSPNDRHTSCFSCHRDQYLETDIFVHRQHIEALDGNSGCTNCHEDADAPKTRANTTPCLDCHQDMVVVAPEPMVAAPDRKSRYLAVGYKDAMHGVCLKCHELEDERNGEERPKLALCATCHAEPKDLTPLPVHREE